MSSILSQLSCWRGQYFGDGSNLGLKTVYSSKTVIESRLLHSCKNLLCFWTYTLLFLVVCSNILQCRMLLANIVVVLVPLEWWNYQIVLQCFADPDILALCQWLFTPVYPWAVVLLSRDRLFDVSYAYSGIDTANFIYRCPAVTGVQRLGLWQIQSSTMERFWLSLFQQMMSQRFLFSRCVSPWCVLHSQC